jgi:hypothetical protein
MAHRKASSSRNTQAPFEITIEVANLFCPVTPFASVKGHETSFNS